MRGLVPSCRNCRDCLNFAAFPLLRPGRGGTLMTLRTALYDWHVAHGARMVDFAGWDMPVQYTTITDEHSTVRNAAGLFDISHMGRLSFSGPDALALIQKIYTNNVATMKVGQVRYGLICN